MEWGLELKKHSTTYKIVEKERERGGEGGKREHVNIALVHYCDRALGRGACDW